jgi:hypothetical protein
MTDPSPKGLAKADARLRPTLSFWHQSPRTKAATQHCGRLVRPSSHSDLNREFRRPRYTEWQWFLIPLLALTIIHFLYFQRWS